MDRIHRLGQRRPVQAIKLVVEESIESRIVQVRLSLIARNTYGDIVPSYKRKRAQW